ncbi:zinc ribbon-containing protein [Paraferrimonas haliotis]|uniref:DUF1451 domain-containing protein n=1 Tax=Paraferrimonas haliotis TaxID=2013866 RepID=A0AA37TPZ0_9GAMM|nr:zinc ribbon-containing protein [Paraferrimonas haliotis]GLS83573.1 DUF1451 domain-containing protein [Paraferrimonas haliotis]
MSERSTRLLTCYHELLMELQRKFQQQPELGMEALQKLMQGNRDYIELKAFADADELALVEGFVRRDIRALLHNRDANLANESPSLLLAEDTMWQWLFSASDQTQIDRQQLAHDLANDGHYLVGEVIGHGTLVCEGCHHQTHYQHPSIISACIECDGERFSRPQVSMSMLGGD